MGINWACTLLGLVSLILCPIPIVFSKFGAQIRRDSHFAPGTVSDFFRVCEEFLKVTLFFRILNWLQG